MKFDRSKIQHQSNPEIANKNNHETTKNYDLLLQNRVGLGRWTTEAQ